MEVTEPFIGLKNKRKQRMAISKVKNGDKIVDTMETGKTIKNMVLLFKFMEMKIVTKEDGSKICVMAKVWFLNVGTMWINVGKGKLWKEYTGDWAKDRKTGRGT